MRHINCIQFSWIFQGDWIQKQRSLRLHSMFLYFSLGLHRWTMKNYHLQPVLQLWWLVMYNDPIKLTTNQKFLCKSFHILVLLSHSIRPALKSATSHKFPSSKSILKWFSFKVLQTIYTKLRRFSEKDEKMKGLDTTSTRTCSATDVFQEYQHLTLHLKVVIKSWRNYMKASFQAL